MEDRVVNKKIIRLIPPVLWEIIFIILFRAFPRMTLYTQMLFYTGIILWFHRDFSFRRMRKCMQFMEMFWRPVIITVASVLLMNWLTTFMGNHLFKGIPDGLFGVWTNGNLSLFLYSISTLILMPLAEELFYRRAALFMYTPATLLLSMTLSAMLYSLQHAYGWVGILEYVLISIPLMLSYVLTRDIYVVIMSHFIVNILKSLPSFAYVVARIVLR